MKKPLLIAEIGVNYYDIAIQKNITPQSAAKLMIAEAKRSGVDIVKFQTYKAEKLAAQNSPAYWDLTEEKTKSQIELFNKYDKFTYNDYSVLAEYCEGLEIEFMSTAFDVDSAESINRLVKRHKIASADITNLELLKKIACFRKPIIMSVGASSLLEIDYAIKFLMENGANDISLLHCVLEYPTPLHDASLWKIRYLKDLYPSINIGYSDHVKFNENVLLTSWLLGAVLIEKHFTLDKSLAGNDHYHAADPSDISNLIKLFRSHEIFIGEPKEEFYNKNEEKSRLFARRGVYLKRDVVAGESVSELDVAFLRPQNDGISSKEFYDCVKNKNKYKISIKKGEQLKSEHI